MDEINYRYLNSENIEGLIDGLLPLVEEFCFNFETDYHTPDAMVEDITTRIAQIKDTDDLLFMFGIYDEVYCSMIFNEILKYAPDTQS